MSVKHIPLETEVEIAAKWWASQIKSKHAEVSHVDAFERALRDELRRRYARHWYPADIMRGSGFRSLSFDLRMDPALAAAAQAASIAHLDVLLSHVRDQVMFVNPGEVKIRNGALLTTSSRIIYSINPSEDGAPSSNSAAGATPAAGAASSSTSASASASASVSAPGGGATPGVPNTTVSASAPIFTPSGITYGPPGGTPLTGASILSASAAPHSSTSVSAGARLASTIPVFYPSSIGAGEQHMLMLLQQHQQRQAERAAQAERVAQLAEEAASYREESYYPASYPRGVPPYGGAGSNGGTSGSAAGGGSDDGYSGSRNPWIIPSFRSTPTGSSGGAGAGAGVGAGSVGGSGGNNGGNSNNNSGSMGGRNRSYGRR